MFRRSKPKRALRLCARLRAALCPCRPSLAHFFVGELHSPERTAAAATATEHSQTHRQKNTKKTEKRHAQVLLMDSLIFGGLAPSSSPSLIINSQKLKRSVQCFCPCAGPGSVHVKDGLFWWLNN